MNKQLFFIILFSIISIFQCQTAQANNNGKPQQTDNKWLNEVRNYKHSFLIKELDMTDEQSKEFIPIYTEMENKIYQANREARKLEQEISATSLHVSDEEYERVATILSQVKTKEAEIEQEYFQRYSKILTKKQLFLLKRAENRFAIDMLNHNKRSKANK